MNSADIADLLSELTGSWVPSGSATHQDLRHARLHLADGLFSGTMPPELPSGARFRAGQTAARAETDSIAQLGQSAAHVMPHVRTAAHLDPASPASVKLTAGMKVKDTLGPFVDSFGIEHWVDLITLPHQVPITSTVRGIMGYLQIADPFFTLGPGGIWIDAAAFNVPVAHNGFVGLSFSDGGLQTTGPVTISPAGVIIDAGGSMTLTLDLAASVPSPPLFAGLGGDATQMSLSPPAHATITFDVIGVSIDSVDASSATVYGTGFSLTRNGSAPRILSAALNYLFFPCDCSTPEFRFQSVLSADVTPSGQTAVTDAGWALPVTPASALQLGEVAGAGTIVLELGAGLSLSFGQADPPASLSALTLVLSPGQIFIWALNGARELTRNLTLWQAAPPAALTLPAPSRYASELRVTLPRGALFFAEVSGQLESIAAVCSATANVDRPLAADGSRLPLVFASAVAGFQRSSSRSVVVGMSQAGALPTTTMALENALVLNADASSALLFAQVSGTRLTGSIQFTFEGGRVFPILADPYAGANQTWFPANVSALATWTLEPGAALTFQIVATPEPPPPPVTGGGGGGDVGPVTTLLDLSGNTDRFGISFEPSSFGQMSVGTDGMALTAPQGLLGVYALPGISWEPVVDEDAGDWLDASSPDDGGPALFAVDSVNLVRMEPDVLLPAFGLAGADVDTVGIFTLPFGLTARLEMTADDPAEQRPSYSFVKGDYASGLKAARQLSIRAQSVIGNTGTAALPGNTGTGSGLPVDFNVYGVRTLGFDQFGAGTFFDPEFAFVTGKEDLRKIPVDRIDISGYGTSMFSDWQDSDLKTAGIKRARFDVLLGRTSFETVQIATVVIPYCFRLTRAVFFDRYDSGLVVRHDTGWKAVGIGQFELLHADQKLLGPVQHFQNIHNITVGTGSTITLSPGRDFAPVTFDADILMAPSVTAISHGQASPVVAATRIQGYAQVSVGPVATNIEILQLMQLLPDGVSGSVGCILNVGTEAAPGAPKFTMNVSSVVVKATSVNAAGQSYPAALAVGVTGVPRLPRDGAWTITRRDPVEAQPAPVDPGFPVPLIFGSNNDGRFQWRLLDPSDALSAAVPSAFFGLMQGTGTSKSLFENPVIDAAGKSLLLDPNLGVPTPRLADMGTLLGSSGIFPNLLSVLRMPAKPGDALTLTADGLRKTLTWDLEKADQSPLDDQTLLNLGVVSLALQYHGPNDVKTKGTWTVDANPAPGDPRWSLSLAPLNIAVFVSGFGDDALLTIHGEFDASETQKPGFNKIAVDYGSALSLIQQIISGLTALVTSLGGSVDLDVSFSDNKLTVHDGLTMPTIPLGFGEIRDVAIDFGVAVEIPLHADFHVGLGTVDKPFGWIVDPLCGTGALVLGAADGNHSVYVEAGIGAALAINVAVASGSASINLELSVAISGSQFELKAALVGNATVELLDGLAGASLTLAASIAMDPDFNGGLLPTAVDLTAAVAVGIHISVAWVVSVDFDGSWSFSQHVPMHL